MSTDAMTSTSNAASSADPVLGVRFRPAAASAPVTSLTFLYERPPNPGSPAGEQGPWGFRFASATGVKLMLPPVFALA